MPAQSKQPMTHWTRVGLAIVGASLAAITLSASTVYYLSQHRTAFASRQNWAGITTLAAMIGCFAIAGVITGVTIILSKRWESRKIAELRSGRGALAHWTYTTSEWQHYAAAEQARGRKLFFVIAGLVTAVLLIPVLQLALSPHAGSAKLTASLVALVPMALAVAIVWLVTVFPTRHLSREAPGNAYIAADGALINDRYYSWTYFAQSLDSVRLIERNPSVIEFVWTQPGYRSSKMQSVRVPVPGGREDEARKLVASFEREQVRTDSIEETSPAHRLENARSGAMHER